MMFQCWPTVFDAGPRLLGCFFNDQRLLVIVLMPCKCKDSLVNPNCYKIQFNHLYTYIRAVRKERKRPVFTHSLYLTRVPWVMLDQLPFLAWLPLQQMALPSQQMALFRGSLLAPLPLGKAGPVRASFVRQVQKFPPHDMSKKNRKNHKICPTKMQMSTTSYMYVRKKLKNKFPPQDPLYISKNNVKKAYLAADIFFSQTYLALDADTTGPNSTRALL